MPWHLEASRTERGKWKRYEFDRVDFPDTVGASCAVHVRKQSIAALCYVIVVRYYRLISF